MSFHTKPSDLDLDKTFKLAISIGEDIEDTLLNWDNSKSKITIESFKRKTHCLVIIKVGHWTSKHHFFKSAIIIKPQPADDLQKLRNLLSLLSQF